MATGLNEEELDVLTTIMEGGDAKSVDKKGISLGFLSKAAGVEESKLKAVLKKLISEGYVEHRFFSDDTDDYILREKGAEALANL